jgi:hypothetical protein
MSILCVSTTFHPKECWNARLLAASLTLEINVTPCHFFHGIRSRNGTVCRDDDREGKGDKQIKKESLLSVRSVEETEGRRLMRAFASLGLKAAGKKNETVYFLE